MHYSVVRPDLFKFSGSDHRIIVPAGCTLDSSAGAEHGSLASRAGGDGLHQYAHASGHRTVLVQRRTTLSENAISCVENGPAGRPGCGSVAQTNTSSVVPIRNACMPVLAGQSLHRFQAGGTFQVGKADQAPPIGGRHVLIGPIGAVQVCTGEVGAREVGVGQIRVGQVGDE